VAIRFGHRHSRVCDALSAVLKSIRAIDRGESREQQVRRRLAGLVAAAWLIVTAGLSILVAAGAIDTQVIALNPGDVPPRTLAGGAGIIIVGLLLLLYLHRRRLYILYWIGGWGSFAGAMFAVSQGSNTTLNAVVYGLSQFLSITSGAFFVFAADSYSTRQRLRSTQLSLLFPVSLWFLLAPVALGSASVAAPGHLLAGIVLTVAGAAHLIVLRGTRLLGAAVVGVMLLLIGFTNVWMALTPRAEVLTEAFLLELALYFVLALGMQLHDVRGHDVRASERERPPRGGAGRASPDGTAAWRGAAGRIRANTVRRRASARSRPELRLRRGLGHGGDRLRRAEAGRRADVREQACGANA
jgi:hypothetical protein